MSREELLVSTDWLAAHLDDPRVRVVDVRWRLNEPEKGQAEYREAHIPGAIYLHWLRDLSDPDDPVEGQIAPPERFREAMERAGIDDGALVVAYDDNEIFMAARLAWCLHYYGHPQVRILDGGLPKWRSEGRPLESGHAAPRHRPGRFTPRPNPALRLTKEEVLRAVAGGTAQLFDCRMDSTWQEAGAHIPGARRLPAPTFLAADGSWRPTEEIAHMIAAAGADRGRPIVLYCGGGVSASCAFIALRLAGYENMAVYDGSWSEWSADPATPKEPHR